MNVYEVSPLAAVAIAARPDRPATAVIHDSADARVVLFRIEPGQQVAMHTSASTVLLTIVSGSGTVAGQEGERTVKAGEIVAYAPHEPHGMRAGDEQLVIAAVIAPRPRAR
jgi:quercetin dioxygenase-like cupin family protein